MDSEFTDWEIFVGRLIVSFGDIELLTYKLFSYWLPNEPAKKLKLGARLKKLIAHIDNLNSQDQMIQEIKNLLLKADNLRKIRNKVAHNPITLRKYDNTNYKKGIIDLRGKKSLVSLENLHEQADEVESVKSKLYILITQFTKKGIDEILFT